MLSSKHQNDYGKAIANIEVKLDIVKDLRYNSLVYFFFVMSVRLYHNYVVNIPMISQNLIIIIIINTVQEG